MSDAKAGIARQFDRGASTYDAHADVQKAMADRLMCRLRATGSEFRRVLEIGCGTGYLTGELARGFPKASIVAMDLSPRMVEIAANKVRSPNVEFAVADAESERWEPESFDLVASNATIQWFQAPGATIALLASALRTHGLMLHLAFGPETFCELRSILDEIDGRPPRPVVTSAGCWAAALRGAGLEVLACDDRLERRHYADFASFLGTIKGTGAAFTPAATGGWEGLRTLRKAAVRYAQRFGSPQGVPVTYQVLELLAARPV